MRSTPTTVEQIDAWRAARSETENLEFKEAKNQFDFENLLAYCVALANERGGVLLLGIANRAPRPVVGTKAYPNVGKVTEDIFNRLRFRVDAEEVQHPDGRVLAFHIPSRPIGHPLELDGTYYMRSGESLVAMTPDQLKQIFAEGEPRRRGAILFSLSVLVLGIIGFFGFQYWAAEHKPRQPEVEVSSTPATGRLNWGDKHNWRGHLRVGMTKKDVRQLFGEPDTISVYSDLETWGYGSGEIQFSINKDNPDGALYAWFEPY